ncbi:MAG: molecular chaperone DnaK, partial [Sphingomonadaceae bacterium]
VTFDIDANGIVNVSAKDKGTGKEQQIRIQASGGLSDDDIENMVKEAEQFADEDKKRKEGAEAKNNAESAVHSIEKQLEEHGDKISDSDKSEIETALQETRDAIEGGDPETMKTKTDALAQASMKLGQAIYESQQAEAASDAGDADAGDGKPEEEEVVDAEFSEVDDDENEKAS